MLISTYFSQNYAGGKLVLIGGVDPATHKTTRQLAVWDEHSQCWMHLYPALQTAYLGPAVASYNKHLIVASGAADRSHLTGVVILDTCTKCWYNGASLLEGFHQMTSAIVGDLWYLMGGMMAGYTTK